MTTVVRCAIVPAEQMFDWEGQVQRALYHRDDVRSILMTAEEAGHALANEQAGGEFVRGYATALRLIAVAFGFARPVVEPRAERTRCLTATAMLGSDGPTG